MHEFQLVGHQEDPNHRDSESRTVIYQGSDSLQARLAMANHRHGFRFLEDERPVELELNKA